MGLTQTALSESQLLACKSDGGGHDRYVLSQQRRKDNEAGQGAGSGISTPVQRMATALETPPEKARQYLGNGLPIWPGAFGGQS